MKTHNYSIFYDDQCPFCIWYSQKFVNWGILTPERRKPFESIFETKYDNIDRDLARNQIALFDEDQKTVKYGAESMITLLALKFSWMIIFLNYTPLRYLAKKLYLFISYNRKVIAPSLSCSSKGCLPDLHRGYRTGFILFTALVTGIILNSFTKDIYTHIYGHQMPMAWEWFVCFGQIFFQGVIIFLISPKHFWDYLGQMSFVSFLGGLALIPLLFGKVIFHINIYFTIVYFGIIVGGMLLLHLRRVKTIGAPSILSVTWIIYRMIILLIMSKM